VAHHEHDQRQAQRRADPEPPGHVFQLGVLFVAGHRSWLQGHAANRARARSVAHDLRMHRADVLRARRGRFGADGLERHAALRTGARPRLPHLRVHGTGVRSGHFSSITFPTAATSLPLSCLVVTLTTQPGLRSLRVSGCSTNPVFPGSVARANFTIFESGLSRIVTSRVLPFAVVWSVRVFAEASIAFTVPAIGASSPNARTTSESATMRNATVNALNTVRLLRPVIGPLGAPPLSLVRHGTATGRRT